jgi:tetratricopeptide (TPR) repeat protein
MVDIPLEKPLESFADLVEPAAPTAGIAVVSAPPAPMPAPVPGEDDLPARVRKTHASLQGKNYYEIFDLTQATFYFDQLKKNYFALTRQFGPDLLMQLAGAEAALAEAILAAVADAYNTLSRNPRNAASRAMQEKARKLLNRALTLERTAAGFAFKGWMLFEAGEDTLAEGKFNKALKLDARQQMARKGLRNLQETRERERKGLFRRMFG